MDLVTTAAMRCGFGGGLLVDYPNSTRAKKYFLVRTPHVMRSPRTRGARNDAILRAVANQLCGKLTAQSCGRLGFWEPHTGASLRAQVLFAGHKDGTAAQKMPQAMGAGEQEHVANESKRCACAPASCPAPPVPSRRSGASDARRLTGTARRIARGCVSRVELRRAPKSGSMPRRTGSVHRARLSRRTASTRAESAARSSRSRTNRVN
jgi:hypothetical protein